MTPPPTPLRERDRLAVLKGLGILDTPPDPSFDAVTRLAAELLQAPIALVSLVDAHRQWFKAAVGMDRSETPREEALCAHAIAAGEGLFEVCDAAADPRFHDNPLVTGPLGVRYYAGVPLRAHGQPVGTLCVLDRVPRRLDASQRRILERFAEMVELQLVQHGRLLSASLNDRRLGDFVAATSDWLWETDGLRVRWVSDNVERVTGVSPARYVGHLLVEGLVDDGPDRNGDNARALAAIREQKAFRDLTVMRVGPAGQRIVVKSGVPVRDAADRFVGYRGVSRNHTEVSAERRARRAAESRLNEAIELLDESIVMTDALDRIVLCNKRWRELHLRPGEAVPLDWVAHLRSMLAEGRIDAAIGREDEWLAERLAARRRPSQPLTHRAQGLDFVIHDQRLSDGGCLTVALDISAITAEHNAAVEAARRLELAVSVAGLAIWEADLDTGEMHRALDSSRGDDPPVPGTVREWLDRIVPADRARVAAGLADVWEGKRDAIREEFTVEHGTRRHRMLIDAAMQAQVPGKARKMIGARRDVTALRRAEQAAREKTAAEMANAAKSEFLARIGHELRTPLNAISGLAQVLHREPDVDTVPSRQSLVGHIVLASEHLSALIDDLLDMAQVESGRVSIRSEPVPVALVLRDCLRMMAPQAAGHGIALVMGRVPDGLMVHADPTRLRQIVLNLLSNAVKYNRVQGRVRLDAGDARTDGFVGIAVSDTGHGMTREEVTRIFRPFERVVRGDGLSTEGLGLGLSIAQGLASAMAGSIEVDSVPGRGTTFTVLLPASPALPDGSDGTPGAVRNDGPDGPATQPLAAHADLQRAWSASEVDALVPFPMASPEVDAAWKVPKDVAAQVGRSSAARPAPGTTAGTTAGAIARPRRVLYVEDNRLNAVLMQQIVRQVPDLTMRVVESGEEALAIVNEFAPDLILLDNDLPGASGVEVYEVLRTDPRFASVPVVLVSADATASSIERARDLGFQDYWVKPLDVERVISALRGPALHA